MTTESVLSEQDRNKLDAIVMRMTAEKESEDTIRAVVGDFKAKYARTPESPAASDPSLATVAPTPGLMEQVASGIGSGARNIATGLMSLPGVLINTPGQVWSDVKDLATRPTEAIPEMMERGKTFGKAMIPMRETGEALLSGEAPSAETVARETTEFGVPFGIAKYAKPAIVGTAKKVTRSLPGASVELNELAAGTMRTLPESVRPTPGLAQRTYGLLDQIGAPKVAMNETANAIVDLLRNEARLASPDKAFVKILRNLQSKIRGGMSFKDIQANAVDFGEKIGQIAANKGTRLGEMRDVLGAIHADAANAIPIGGTTPHAALQLKSGVWDTARMLSRREFAANDLSRMIEKSGISTVGDGFTQVNTNKIVSQIEDMMKLAKQDKKARLFVESFQPGELQGIVDTLNEIGKRAPKVPAKTGAPVGSSQRWIEAGIGGLAGTGVGAAVGSPGLGATVGAMTAPLASNLIAKAMMTDAGRSLVRHAVSPTGRVTPQSAALFSLFLKAQGEQP